MDPRRVAFALLRLYPRAWRERYGDEMRALLQESALSTRQLLDLAAGVCAEWARWLVAPTTAARILSHRPAMWLFRTSLVFAPFVMGAVVCRSLATLALDLADHMPTAVTIIGVGLIPVQFFGIVRLQRNLPIGDTVPRHAISRTELWRWFALFLIGGVGQQILQLMAYSGATPGGWYMREFSLMFGFPLLAFGALVPQVVDPWFRRVTGRHLFSRRPPPNVPPRPLGLG